MSAVLLIDCGPSHFHLVYCHTRPRQNPPCSALTTVRSTVISADDTVSPPCIRLVPDSYHPINAESEIKQPVDVSTTQQFVSAAADLLLKAPSCFHRVKNVKL